MRGLVQSELKATEEIYRVINTMMKKLKMGRKSEKVIYAEAVTDIMWIMKILPFKPRKFSVVAGEEQEEIAKLIFYPHEDSVVMHDLYVAPKMRKQGLAKSLISEVLLLSSEFPKIGFYARETNKPVSNLVNYFISRFRLDPTRIKKQIVPVYYVDGGNAVVYEIPNPVYEMKKREEKEIQENQDELSEANPVS